MRCAILVFLAAALATFQGAASAEPFRIGPKPAKISPAALAAGDPVSAIHKLIVDQPVPNAVVAQRRAAQQDAARVAEAGKASQILFGDLHAHTAYSDDAYFFGLPLFTSAHELRPPMSACNYARFVSQLDFLAVTDHGETYLPQIWRDGVQAMRLCNGVGDPAAPDLTTFLGFEWTAIGVTADTHYGHRNVVFRGLDDESLPTRSIGFYRSAFIEPEPEWVAADPDGASEYAAYLDFLKAYRRLPHCESEEMANDPSADCYELQKSPDALHARLDRLGLEAITIPHGMAWGYSSPLRLTWDNNLSPEQLDSKREPLIEIFSGHGNSEPYRAITPRLFDSNGAPYCPGPTWNYEPPCWRAGLIIEARCLAASESKDVCAQRRDLARQRFVEVNSAAAWLTVPGSQVEDWLDAGQPRDLDLPAMNYRPRVSAQAGLARSGFVNGQRQRFLWGFVGSSDNHGSRPGNGFKQINRLRNVDSLGGKDERRHDLLMRPKSPPDAYPVDIANDTRTGLGRFGGLEVERQASFMYTGGLAAVHAQDRSRAAIWEALTRRETYATSGSRTLLWFDLLNAGARGNVKIPMGGEATMVRNPKFRVVAAGSFDQKPGCPEFVMAALGRQGVQSLADGECYNPSDKRRGISRIEVIKIIPQINPEEPIEGLIQDPWRSFDCRGRPICRAEFKDRGFDRDASYYVRVYEVEQPTINAGTLRATFNEDGQALSVRPCHASYKTPLNDDCLSVFTPMAWASPIYVNRAAP